MTRCRGGGGGAGPPPGPGRRRRSHALLRRSRGERGVADCAAARCRGGRADGALVDRVALRGEQPTRVSSQRFL